MRERLRRIIFESDTRAGRAFDLGLIVAILLSLAVVVFDSMDSVSARFQAELDIAEWVITSLFTIEYLARLYAAPRRWRYARSFFGVIDLLAILPTFLALAFPNLHALVDVRALRLLRIFRILKLTQYLAEFRHLGLALAASRRKILVFLSTVCTVVLVMGTLMYVVEGPANGFTSIPTGVYWAITTMTTVGFGDITPKTDLGRAIASVMMLLGWGVLAVPTGIVTAEMVGQRERGSWPGPATGSPLPPGVSCPQCGETGLGLRDRFCRQCGSALPSKSHPEASEGKSR